MGTGGFVTTFLDLVLEGEDGCGIKDGGVRGGDDDVDDDCALLFGIPDTVPDLARDGFVIGTATFAVLVKMVLEDGLERWRNFRDVERGGKRCCGSGGVDGCWDLSCPTIVVGVP